jgi:uncharacterized coiled-coil protein SlyX
MPALPECAVDQEERFVNLEIKLSQQEDLLDELNNERPPHY